MTLVKLKYFVTAARHRNISRAADDLSVSQPSVSQAIAELEDEFGVRLILRGQRGFSLTEAGEELLWRSESLLQSAELTEKAMTARGRNKLLVKVGIPPMIGSMLLDKIFGETSLGFPTLKISVTEGGREELFSKLSGGEIDMAILPHTEPVSKEYSSLFIGREETVLATSEKNPLSELPSVKVGELENEPLALFTNGYFITDRIMKLFAASGKEPLVMHTSAQLSALLELISAGVSSGFLFRSIVESRQGVRAVSTEPPLFTDISLVWKRDGYITEAMKQFTEIIGRISK